jgi:hypothetical protein
MAESFLGELAVQAEFAPADRRGRPPARLGRPIREEPVVSHQTADRGDAFVRAGAILFALGAVATLVTFVPLFLDLTRLPTAAYWVCMTMPLGLLVSLVGLLVSARAQRRRAQAAAQ